MPPLAHPAPSADDAADLTPITPDELRDALDALGALIAESAADRALVAAEFELADAARRRGAAVADHLYGAR